MAVPSQRLHNFGRQHEDDKVVDPHHYLLGRERPVVDDKEILGRRQGDSDQLFPRYAQASVTATGEYTVNGTSLNAWTLAQLEPLSQAVLRQRANAIRRAAGEANCPPLPSGQPMDIIRWILRMQSELSQEGSQNRKFEEDNFKAFALERPASSEKQSSLPFGPRTGQDHEGTRDHFGQLISQSPSGGEAPKRGIVTQRSGGEGRRHLSTSSHMISCGVSGVEPKGIGSLRAEGEGKRPIACRDSLMEQKRESEALERGPGVTEARMPPTEAGGRRGAGRHISETSMLRQGEAAGREEPIGGERRRHAEVPDRMESVGVANPGESEGKLMGRRHLDGFRGAVNSDKDQQRGYQSSWRKDPSKLRGQPMLV